MSKLITLIELDLIKKRCEVWSDSYDGL